MAYTVAFTNNAEKQFAKLDAVAAGRIVAKIEALSADPYEMPGVKQLKGKLKGISRIRAGDYRILYQVQNTILTILIVAIADRKDVYQ